MPTKEGTEQSGETPAVDNRGSGLPTVFGEEVFVTDAKKLIHQNNINLPSAIFLSSRVSLN